MPSPDYLDGAIAAVLSADPFHGSMLMEVELIDLDENSTDEKIKARAEKIKTAATDGYARIWFNRKFMEALSVPCRAAVLVHEVQHIIRFHLGARAERCVRMAQSRSISAGEAAQLFNIACDFIINQSLQKMGYPIDKVMGAVTFKEVMDALASGKSGKVGAMLDMQLPNVSEEELFGKLLVAHSKNPNASCNQPTIVIQQIVEGNGGSDLDQEAKNDSMSQDNMTPEQTEQKVQTSVMAAAQRAATMGALPGYIEGIITELVKPVNNWRRTLRQFIGAFSRDDYSYRRISRRSAGTEFIRPSMFSEKVGEIAVIVDESGSVSDRDLQQGLSELVAISKNVKPTGITVVMCDTRVTSAKRFKPGDKIALKTGGRGGTDMNPAFDLVRDTIKNAACVICFTDGYIPEVERRKTRVPLMWVICNNTGDTSHFKPKHGKVIAIKEIN